MARLLSPSGIRALWLTRTLALASIAASSLAITSCKKKNEDSCVPEEQKFKVRVALQGGDRLNLDQEGNPLATVVRVYQLKGDETLQAMDHRTVWEKGKDAFGDEFVAVEERTIYPEKGELIEFEPDPATTHVVAVALFREPTGVSWFRVWEMPKFHGDRVCLDKRQGKPTNDPCFLVLLDENRVDGGHTAPPGFDVKEAALSCPPPPLKVKPPAPEKKKKKKKKKKPDLDKAKKAKEASETEPPAEPEGPAAPEGPEAPEAPGGG